MCRTHIPAHITHMHMERVNYLTFEMTQGCFVFFRLFVCLGFFCVYKKYLYICHDGCSSTGQNIPKLCEEMNRFIDFNF